MADWRLSRLLIAGIVTMGVAAVPAVARADSGSSPSTSSQTTPADASSAPDEATASAIAAAYGHQVEVSSLDDASSTTFMEPNGLTMEELSTTPVRVQQPDGSWKTTDLTLQQNADGSISPAVSPVDVTLGGAGSHTVATLNVGSGSVSYGWSGQLPAPTLSGSTATYADVAPGVNLVANVTTSGVETSVVFESAEAASARAVDLAVTASGLTATKDSSGVVSYADSSGSVVAQTPTPQAWDSELGGDLVGPGAGPVAGVPSALTTAAGNVLSATPASGAVTSATGVMTDQLQVPTSLLNDPSTTYPLVLDPGVICDDCSTGAHGYVENDGYNEINSSFDNGYVHVGTFDGGTTITRGLYTFTQGEIHGQNIISANLNLMDEYSYSCTREPVTVYYSAAISSGSNWSNATIGSQSDGATGGAFADGYDSACPAGPVGFPVTNIVAAFAASSSADMYFQLRTNEADDFYWKKFSGTASLDVYWASTPTWPAGRSVTPCWAQCSGWIDTYSTQPDLTGAATTGDKEHLDYTFEVYNSNSSWGVGSLADSLSVDDVADGALASTGQGSGGAWGTHALASGVHYYVYRVRACDQSVPSICGAWSSDANGWVEFEVDTGSPAVPAASVGGVSGSNPAPTVDFDTPSTVSFSPGSGGTGGTIYGYAYSLNDTPPTYGQGTAVPACGSDNNGVWFACAGSSQDASGSVAAIVQPTSTVYVWAYTMAGVMSGADSQPLNVIGGSISSGHSWVTDQYTAPVSGTCEAGPVPDSQSTGGFPLTLPASGVCWQPSTDSGAPTVINPNTGATVNAGALDFTSASAATPATTGVSLNTLNAYTVAAWVDVPASALDGGYHTVMSESSSSHSSLYLQSAPVTVNGASEMEWRLCLHDQTAANGTHCTNTSYASGITPNSWYYLTGEWDPANDQIRLYVNRALVMTTSYTPPSGDASATGGVTVGDATDGGAPSNFWVGQVIDPVAIQAIADPAQMANMSLDMLPPSEA